MSAAPWEALGASAASMGALAAWVGALSPGARRKRQERREREETECRYRRETHEALYGIPELRDDSGALIRPPLPGLLAEFQAQKRELKTLRAEFPVNGVPARVAIDAANVNINELRRDLTRVERKVDEGRQEYHADKTALKSILAEQGIRTPN